MTASPPPGKDAAKALIERMLKRIAASKGELANALALSASALSRRLGPRYPHDLFSEDELDRIAAFLELSPGQRQFLSQCYGHRAEVNGTAGAGGSTEAGREPAAPLPPVPALPPPLPDFPVHLTSFVGRQRELATVSGLLARARLVTLTGAGGCGKTRLALAVAEVCAERYPDGVRLVDLAGLTSAALVPQAVATVLGVQESGEQAAVAALAAHLRERQLLLVLDNCEHLRDACAALGSALLRAAPAITILATSRERLGVAGEVAWTVPPLSLPDSDSARMASGEGGGAMPASSDAVQLFAERARVVRPDFVADEDTLASIVRICRHLDGLPLAIELAAARLRLLPVTAIAERLHDSISLLTDGSGTGRSHHQTLRSAIDWSYEQLSDLERACFRALAVFAGGFTLEGAEAVLGGLPDQSVPSPPGIEPLPPADLPVLAARAHVLDLLAGLADKSLLVAEGGGGTGRFRLLEPLRQYAVEQLEEAPPIPWQGATLREAGVLRSRHAEWCLRLAEQGDQGMRGPEQPAWVARLNREQENLRAALAWCAAPGRAELGQRIAGCLALYWDVSGRFSEARSQLKAVLRFAGGPPRVRLRALIAAGNFAVRQSDLASAFALFTEARALAEQEADRLRLSLVLNGLGLVAFLQAEYPAAEALFEETLAVQHELGNRNSIGATQSNLGLVMFAQGWLSTARERFQQSLRIWRDLEDRWQIALALHNLGSVLEVLGDDAGARAAYEECARLRAEIGDRRGGAEASVSLARLACAAGDTEQAHVDAETALGTARELGDRMGAVAAQLTLSMIVALRGDPAGEQGYVEAAMALAEEIEDRRAAVEARTRCSEAALSRGDYEEAQAQAGRAAAIARELGLRRHLAAALTAEAGAALVGDDPNRARTLLGEALPLWLEMGSLPGQARAFAVAALLAAGDGRLGDGGRLLGACLALFRALGRQPHRWEAALLERARRRVQKALGSNVLEAACRNGAELTREEAVALALAAKAPAA